MHKKCKRDIALIPQNKCRAQGYPQVLIKLIFKFTTSGCPACLHVFCQQPLGLHHVPQPVLFVQILSLLATRGNPPKMIECRLEKLKRKEEISTSANKTTCTCRRKRLLTSSLLFARCHPKHRLHDVSLTPLTSLHNLPLLLPRFPENDDTK